MTITVIGATSIGIVVAYLVGYFVTRLNTFTPQALATIIGIMFGGAVVKIFASKQELFWFYPIGLIIGFIIYAIVYIKTGGNPANLRY